MSGATWDDMLDEAREELRRQEEENPNAELGDAMTPEPESHFQGRWRGVGPMQTKSGLRHVFLVWRHGDDAPGFLYQHTQLVVQVEEQRPEVGDEVLVLRGPTREYETKDGESRSTFPYVLRKRPCSDPLPTGPAELEETSGGMLGDNEELPF
jgi:hypothetical protein